MKKITKKEFVEFGKSGLYYLGSAWRDLDAVVTIIKNSKLNKNYSKRILVNETLTNLHFKTENGDSYIDIAGSNISIHKEANIIYVYSIYDNSDNNVVVYKVV